MGDWVQATRGEPLLKLRKVELLGFKSFCEKTTITFSGTGVTCIVGPNGCGKSNVVDAISWVLGEQSHKSLRAARMSDCIFNGTQKRPPLGLAEVTITLVDPELAEAAAKVLEEVKDVEEVEEAKDEEAGSDAAVRLDAAAAEGDLNTENPEGTEGTESWAEKKFRHKRTARPLPQMKPGEVVIGRRLYRSGQSEYLINGRVARLRDIQEMFMGLGLGPDSYAIIEQGRIGQILSSKPQDRRAIIEEAAGVTKYKTKRRLAEAKLEASKLNLSRVNDILVEVEKQLASLKRQASKARRYAEIREQMRGLLRTVLASKAGELEREAARLETLLKEIAATEAESAARIQQLEADHERLEARAYALESELRHNQNSLSQCALELDRAENRIGFNRERLRELGARDQQLTAEIEQAQRQTAQLAGQARAHAASVAALREQKRQLESGVEQMAAALAQLTAAEQAAEARIAALREAAGQWGEELVRLGAVEAQAEEALAHHLEARTRLEQDERQLETVCSELRERVLAAEARWQSAQAEAAWLTNGVAEGQSRLTALRARREETSQRFDAVREQLAGTRARRTSLLQILEERSYTADAVQKLFAANGEGESRGFRAVGLLADYAEVQEQYEGAIEQFLRDELEYVVVETFDHARAGISMLREEMGGRATFFVDSLRNLQLKPGEPPVAFRAEQGVISRLDRLVDFRDPLGPAAKQFLPKLQAAYLVETAGAAESLARDNPQYHFITLDGTCYNGRTVSGGRPGEAGPLAMKRELRAVETEVIRLERSVEETQAEMSWLEEELRTAQQKLDEMSAARVEAEKALVAATHQRDQMHAEMARLSQQLSEQQAELERLNGEAEAATNRATEARHQREAARHSRTAAEAEMAQLAGRVVEVRREILAQQEQLSSLRAELATLAERVAGAEATEARIAAEQRETAERENALAAQQAALVRERNELEAGTAEQHRRATALAAEKMRLEESKAALEQEWEQARVRRVETEDALRMARQKLGDVREERGQHEVNRARNQAERDHLRTSCLEELNAHPEDLMAQQEGLLAGEELVAAETNYREMRARIEAMGPVNMMALEEYQECEQRFTFLSRERDDLVKSIEDTLQTIKELDEVCRERFRTAFEAINANFAEAFRTLFGGGTGEMRLTEADSSGDCGIDVVAQPPGKRLQNVMLLSGGEKALTALALLIAIFRYQPSPFCILDEVDAPLDEANVGRFTKMIGEMSEQTQFIVVTHNRRTMEIAPVLYGVTMQEPGVSKLVSVRWDEPADEAQPSAA
jgi:chromosome segregation protein